MMSSISRRLTRKPLRLFGLLLFLRLFGELAPHLVEAASDERDQAANDRVLAVELLASRGVEGGELVLVVEARNVDLAEQVLGVLLALEPGERRLVPNTVSEDRRYPASPRRAAPSRPSR